MRLYRFQAIKTELLRIDASLTDLTKNQVEEAPDTIYRTHLDRLNQMAATPVADAVVRRLMTDIELRPAVARISRLKRENGLRLEIKRAGSIAAASDPWACLKRFVYYPNYLALARMEYGGARLQAGDRVVFLGSGPLPLSLICLWRQHHIKGVGIEQHAERAALSYRVIRRLGLERHIQIICGNHFTLTAKMPSRLIMVGADAAPKAGIFGHLATTLEPGQLVSYRIYEKGLRRLFDDSSDFDLPSEFRECGRVRPEPPVNNTCVFALKVC